MPRLSLRLLGPPLIEVDGHAVSTDRRKAVALLSYVAVTATPQRRESLAALLWPDYETSAALAYLRRTLWEINQILGAGWLEANREQVQLKSGGDVWLDLAAFQTLARKGNAGDDLDALRQAVEMVHGDFMAGFTLLDAPEFDNWQRYQTEAVRSELGAILAHLAEDYGGRGEYETALLHAQRWVALDDLNEPSHRLLMRLYVREGNRAAALRQYDLLARLLKDELNADPDTETQALMKAIRAGKLVPAPTQPAAGAGVGAIREDPSRDGPGKGDVGNMPSSPTQPALNLPVPATHFIGRAVELRAISDHLAKSECRLLTLVGPGGIGKTRLAIQAAAGQAGRFADGIYFVRLAGLDNPDQVWSATADALLFSFRDVEADVRKQLLDFLRGKRLLLVLDNCEHLLRDDGFTLPSDIVATAPGVVILATSRVRLQVQGEQVVTVDGLDMPPHDLLPRPDESYGSLDLFVESARRVQPNFVLTAANSTAVAGICRLVDGMPLGIELAAGWMGVLSADEILAEMNRDIDFLESDLRDVPSRQRSLRRVFDASWSFLTAEEQDTYRRLSIFRASFGREAAQAVAATSLRMLSALVNKSMVRRTADGRFDLHPLLAQYANDRLSSDPEATAETQRRYCRYYLGFLESQGRAMRGPGQKAALDVLAVEGEHIRTAFLRAIELGWYGEANAVLETLYLFQVARSYLVFDSFLAAGLESLESRERDAAGELLLARLLAVRSSVQASAWWPSHLSRQLGQHALSLVRQHDWGPRMGRELSLLGVTYVWHIERDTGLELLAEAENLLRQSGDELGLVMALNARASALERPHEREEAMRLLTESIALSRRIGSPLQLAEGLGRLGVLMLLEQDYQAAISFFEESSVIVEAAGDKSALNNIAYSLGDTYLAQGEYGKAVAAFTRARQLCIDYGDTRSAANVLSWVSIAAARAGDMRLAFQARRQGIEEFQGLGDWHGLAWCYWELGELYRQQGELWQAREQYLISLDLFEKHDVPRGVVFFHRAMGDIEQAAGDLTEAEKHFQTSLDLAAETVYFWAMSAAECGLGRVEVAKGNPERARWRFGQAFQHARDWADQGLLMAVVLGLATSFAAQDDYSTVAELCAFLHSQRATQPEHRRQAESMVGEASRHLPAEELERAQSQGRSLTLDTIISKFT